LPHALTDWSLAKGWIDVRRVDSRVRSSIRHATVRPIAVVAAPEHDRKTRRDSIDLEFPLLSFPPSNLPDCPKEPSRRHPAALRRLPNMTGRREGWKTRRLEDEKELDPRSNSLSTR